jgi:replicative superfamily II helicase
MINLGLVEEELGRVRLTLLGRACGQSTLSFRSALRLVELIESLGATPLTAERLVALLQGLPEMDRVYTPILKSKTKAKDSGWPNQTASRYGNDIAGLLQRFAEDNDGYLARCKRASLLSDWTNGVPIEAIEEQYSGNLFSRVGYGDIRSIADTTRFHLRSARQIVALLLAGTPDLEAQIDRVLRQLEVGIPADSIDLLDLPLTFDRADYLALRHAGIRTRAELWAAPSDAVRTAVGNDKASRLDSLRP